MTSGDRNRHNSASPGRSLHAARPVGETRWCLCTCTTLPGLTLALGPIAFALILVPRARTMATLIIPLKENVDEAPGPCRRCAGTRCLQDEGRDPGDRY